MDKQLAEIRRMHAERAARQRESERAHPEEKENEKKEKKGKVIGGKYFEHPPNQLGMKEYEEIVNHYQRVKRQKKSAVVSKIEVDTDTADLFQSFLRARSFAFLRVGILYGTVSKEGLVRAHACYEPEQECRQDSFHLLPDSRIEKVDRIAALLGLQRVGVIVSSPPSGPDAPVLRAEEVLLCAEHQAKHGSHCCLVQVRVGEDRSTISVEAYQVSQQCVDIWKEGTLSVCPTNGRFVHSERELEAVQEQSREKGGKAMVTKESTYDVDTVWFTVPVPIGGFASDVVGNRFIRSSRPGEAPPVWDNVKLFLKDPKRSGKPFVEQIRDFHLLLFLAEHLDVRTEFPNLVGAILARDSHGIEGTELLIKTAAQMM